MKTKIILFGFIAVFSISIAFGQEKTENKYQKIYKHSFGVGTGFTTGLGMSYRYFPQKIGFQLNLTPYYRDYGNEAFVSVGTTLLYNLAESRSSAVYAYLGNHYLYRTNYYESYYDPVTGLYHSNFNKKETINTGFGVGFEFNTSKKVTLNIMGGYAQYNSFEMLFFTGELALYYRFN